MRSISRFGLWNAAAVNSVRWALYQHLLATGLPVEIGTGGRTKWNRARLHQGPLARCGSSRGEHA